MMCFFVFLWGINQSTIMMKRVLLGVMLLLPCMGLWAQHHNIKEIRGTRYEVTSALDGAHKKSLDALLAPYKKGVDSIMAPVLGESKVAMTGGRPESLLGNWAADALVEQSNFDGKGKADMGLFNVGGLRNNMPRGIVRQGDIMLISPFQNFLCVVQLKGTELMELFANIAAVGGEALSHEVKLVITKKGELKSATVSGKAVEPERIYNIATLDYVAEGNDKMHALKKRISIRQSDIAVRDVLMKTIRQHVTIDSKIEGRVVVER